MNSNGHKRTSEHIDLSEPPLKRQKYEHKMDYPTIVQARCYAAEMFAAHTGCQHVIGLIVIGMYYYFVNDIFTYAIIDDCLYVQWYDQQGTIQCSGFNFIQDLPRFLVLLLAMQRFENQHWGLNPTLDPNFGPQPVLYQTTLNSQKDEIKASLELSNKEQVGHFGLDGRATNVFSIKSTNLTNSEGDEIIAKVFWEEAICKSEPEILESVYCAAQDNMDIKGHVPEMLWHTTFQNTSTAMIRQHLGLKTQGARILYMIIFHKLRPVTELAGDDFLHAWWDAVKCE